MQPTLTVVLPVRNAEASLRGQVTDVLETAGELTDRFRVLLVDDGSTDDTFDVAVELSHRYPQVEVMRNARHRGLGPTLRSVRAKVKSDVVIIHDGMTAFDANQIRRLWNEQRHRAVKHPAGAMGGESIHDLKLVATTHAAMAAAHSQLLGFQLMNTAADADINAQPPASVDNPTRRHESPAKQGIGAIPPLPRPNFMGALANFALGE